MSLSDTEHQGFQPIAIHSLENFDGEHSSRTPDSKPDIALFKALFEKPVFQENEKEEIQFKDLYTFNGERDKDPFRPLVKGTDEGIKKKGYSEPDDSDTSPDKAGGLKKEESEKDIPEPPSAEETGYQKGFEQGIEEGKQQGYEEGVKKGEQKGLEEGKKKGIEQGREEGFEQGKKEGQEKGEALAAEKAEKTLMALEESLKTADNALDSLIEKYEAQIIELIERIVEKIVSARVEIDDEIVKNAIVDSMKALVKPEEVVLSVSEEDYEYVEMIKEEFFDAVKSLKSVSVKSDSSLQRGGCRIETSTSSISSDMESRLEAVFEAVKNAGAV